MCPAYDQQIKINKTHMQICKRVTEIGGEREGDVESERGAHNLASSEKHSSYAAWACYFCSFSFCVQRI